VYGYRGIPARGVVPIRDTPRGQPWTPVVIRPQGRDGLSVRRMAVLWTCCEPSLGRHVHRELLRSVWLDLPSIIAATTCHQRNYVERYSRYNPDIIYETEPRWSWVWRSSASVSALMHYYFYCQVLEI